MAIPVGATTITVRRRAQQQENEASLPFDEPVELAYTIVATGVRATIGLPREREMSDAQAIGSRSAYRFIADPADIQIFDRIEDERSGSVYEVAWAARRVSLLGDLRVEGGLALFEGPQYATS